MTNLSAIEESSETHSKGGSIALSNTYYNDVERDQPTTTTFGTGDCSISDNLSAAPSRASRTSKSASVLVSVDPRMFELASRAHSGNFVNESERQSTLFLGSCCDLVKSCIILNTVYTCLAIIVFAFSLLGLMPYLMRADDVDEASAYYDDDEFREQETGFFTFGKPSFVRTVVRLSGAVVFPLMGTVGAAWIYKYLVLCTAIWYLTEILMGCMGGMWTGVILAAFSAYSHIALFLAFAGKQITRENYENEKYCCGCRGFGDDN